MSSSAQMIHDEHHRALVRRLAAELKPTRSMWPVSIRLALWMALEIGILMWVMTGSGRNVIGRLKEPAYAMEVLFFGFAAVILATLALRSAIPGRYLSAREASLAGLLALAGVVGHGGRPHEGLPPVPRFRGMAQASGAVLRCSPLRGALRRDAVSG